MSNGLNVDGENGAGSQLQHPISCRTKHRKIQGPATTYCHSHHVDLCFQGELNDLLIWFSDAHCCFNLEGLAGLRWNQSIELLLRSRYGLFLLSRSWNLIQHVQQGELRVVLRRRRDRI